MELDNVEIMENRLVKSKLDHFFDVQHQMKAAVKRREALQQKVGIKLKHCKLKGHEDIADAFKRLINIKQTGTYYAVKAAQMQPLIQQDRVLPSKTVQRRIEGVEMEIFSLLSSESVRPAAVDCEISKLDISNCMKVLNEGNARVRAKLGELAIAEQELGEKDSYTEEGFHKRDTETMKKLAEEKEQMQLKLSSIETEVQAAIEKNKESDLLLNQAEAKMETMKSFARKKKEEIESANRDFLSARIETAQLRQQRNELLSRVVLQRKALKRDGADGVHASESLYARKKDIEEELRGKSERLKELKRREQELALEERALEAAELTKRGQLEQVKKANAQLDEKIAGMREVHTRVSRDIESTLEDVSKSSDTKCTVWRDKALGTIFAAGLLDMNLIKNKIFASRDKYKFPTERYQLIETLKPELGMLQAGISYLQDQICEMEADIDGLNAKSKLVEKRRTANQTKHEDTKALVARTTGKLQRLDRILVSTTTTIENQLTKLTEVLPKTNMLETMDVVLKHEVLGSILPQVDGVSKIYDVIKEYHTLKREIHEGSGKHSKAMSWEFLKRDCKYQDDLRGKLERQLAHIERLGARPLDGIRQVPFNRNRLGGSDGESDEEN